MNLWLTTILFAATGIAKCPATEAGGDCNTGLPVVAATGATLQHIVQLVIGIFAAVTVLIIVIAALNMITAQGDPQKVVRARESMIYALVGLVVAISAEI